MGDEFIIKIIRRHTLVRSDRWSWVAVSVHNGKKIFGSTEGYMDKTYCVRQANEIAFLIGANVMLND